MSTCRCLLPFYTFHIESSFISKTGIYEIFKNLNPLYLTNQNVIQKNYVRFRKSWK